MEWTRYDTGLTTATFNGYTIEIWLSATGRGFFPEIHRDAYLMWRGAKCRSLKLAKLEALGVIHADLKKLQEELEAAIGTL